MDKYNMVLPRITYSGVDALENLRLVVAGHKKAAIFTDKGILGAGLVDLPQEIVRSAGVETVILSAAKRRCRPASSRRPPAPAPRRRRTRSSPCRKRN